MSVADEDTAPSPGSLLKAGDVVGRYRIEARIGGGGMGVVYRATDTTLGRAVALKFLAPQVAGAGEARARLLREARAASALDHPHIGTVYEVGEHAGGAFIAMAFYDGETLKDRIGRGPLRIGEAQRFARELAAALQAAHAAGIAHRDVKPANVMLTRDGSVRLVDFGLAKLLDEATAEALTASGTLLGTLTYMAPEQLRGEGADTRADLWALGTVAYEMLTGKPPFARGERAATITAILTSEPPPIERDDVPPPLRALIGALLEKDPARRIGSASEVLSVIDQTSPAPRRRRPRRRWLAPTAAALVVAVAGALAAWQWWPSRDRRLRAEFEAGEREFNLGHFEAALPHFETVYRETGEPMMLYNLAQQYRLAGHPKEARWLFKQFAAESHNLDVNEEAGKHIRELDSEISRLDAQQRGAAPPPTAAPPPPAP